MVGMVVEDAFENIRECTHVEEAAELASLVKSVVDSQGAAARSIAPRFIQILQKYQEQSYLLDPLLEDLVTPLAAQLRTAAEGQNASLASVQSVSCLLWALVTVRGHKTVMRFFPNQAADLEPVLALLARLDAEGAAKSSIDDEEGGVWEAQCTLLLWLAILVLLPFHMASLDSTLTATTATGCAPIVFRISAMCQTYLAQPGSVRNMAALVAGRLLTRPDTGPALQEMVAWAAETLKCCPEELAPFLVPGVTATLAAILKAGLRQQLLPVVAAVWQAAVLLPASPTAASNVLTRKLAVKLVQRLGLTLLPPRAATWAHQPTPASLTHTLQLPTDPPSAASVPPQSAGGSSAHSIPSESLPRVKVGSAPSQKREEGDQGLDKEDLDLEMEEDIEIPEEVEETIEVLLTALRDKDTVVRWSAAKGLARITARLPRALGGDIADSVLDLFRSSADAATAWHGGCLALAELARRGLLPVERLPEAAPLIARALHFDVRRGPHSVGAHVRDAAAFVCWAFARAYTAEALSSSLPQLAPALLAAAVYDREVNCRRAAAAAFQECVGRLGGVAHGIEVLTAADYFTLSTRSQAYLVVAPYLASFPEYRPALREALLSSKLRHWERSLRELAAAALGALVTTDTAWALATALPQLRMWALDPVLELRHGAIVGIAEILLALAAEGTPLLPPLQESLAAVVPDILAAQICRGKGGELMRAAVCRLIECTAIAGLTLSVRQSAALLEAVNDNLRHPSADLQTAAVAALRALVRMQGATTSSPADEGLGFAGCSAVPYVEGLRLTNSVPARRGCAMALGALPAQLLQPVAARALQALSAASQLEANPDSRDAECRACAVRGLVAVASQLFAPGTGDLEHSREQVLNIVLPALMAAMDDYSVDNRGDVGSWVREAAMKALQESFVLLRDLTPPQEQAAVCGPIAQRMEAAFLKQGVERIARVREAAAQQLASLLKAHPPIPGDVQRMALDSCVISVQNAGSNDSQVLTSYAALLRFPPLQMPLMEGLTASIGGLDASLGAAASSALLRALTSAGPRDERREGTESGAQLLMGLTDCLLDIWGRHARSQRMALPLLRTADLLLTQGGLADLLPPTAGTADGIDIAAGSIAAAAEVRLLALVELAKGEARSCTDVGRLMGAASLLCHAAGCGGTLRGGALAPLMVLLLNRYPKVRKHTAEQLYLQLLGEDDEDGLLDSVMETLSDVAWDGDLTVARAARSTLFEPLGLQPPKAAASPAGFRPSVNEQSSGIGYGSLVADAARGG